MRAIASRKLAPWFIKSCRAFATIPRNRFSVGCGGSSATSGAITSIPLRFGAKEPGPRSSKVVCPGFDQSSKIRVSLAWPRTAFDFTPNIFTDFLSQFQIRRKKRVKGARDQSNILTEMLAPDPHSLLSSKENTMTRLLSIPVVFALVLSFNATSEAKGNGSGS
jgi:hypothetical protein